MMNVYRLGNQIALSLSLREGGKTIYLYGDEARRLAKALLEGTQDIEAQPFFSDSKFASQSFPFSGDRSKED